MQDCDVILEPVPPTEADVVAEPTPDRSTATKVVLSYLLCGITWGTTWYAIRVCVAPGGYTPFAAAAIRFTLASLLFAITCYFYRRRLRMPTGVEVKWLMFCGFLSAVGYVLLYTAERTVSGGLCAVLSATTPLIAALLASFTGVERLSKTVVAGSVVAFLGVLLVFLDRLNVSPTQASAAALVIAMCFFGAASNTGTKRHAHNIPPLVTTTVFFTTIAIVLWIGALVAGECTVPQPLPFLPTLALLHLTIPGTFMSFICYFYFLKHVRLSTATSLSFVTPVIALVIDTFVEKQAVLSTNTYLGIATVLVGVGLCMFVQIQKEKGGPKEVTPPVLKNQKTA